LPQKHYCIGLKHDLFDSCDKVVFSCALAYTRDSPDKTNGPGPPPRQAVSFVVFGFCTLRMLGVFLCDYVAFVCVLWFWVLHSFVDNYSMCRSLFCYVVVICDVVFNVFQFKLFYLVVLFMFMFLTFVVVVFDLRFVLFHCLCFMVGVSFMCLFVLCVACFCKQIWYTAFID